MTRNYYWAAQFEVAPTAVIGRYCLITHGTRFETSGATMFIDRMVNQGNIPLVERMMKLTAKRHELLSENIANLSTPGYQQKDLDVGAFQQMLRERAARRRAGSPGTTSFADLDPASLSVDGSGRGMLFHDRANRSVEALMGDMSSNAMKYNLFVELLRKQYGSFDNVLRERVS